MTLLIALGTFLCSTLTLYGLLYRSQGDGGMETRLDGLRSIRPARAALPPERSEGFVVRVLKPLMMNTGNRFNRLLPTTWSQRIEAALVQGGVKLSMSQFMLMIGLSVGILPFVLLLLFASTGASLSLSDARSRASFGSFSRSKS